MRDVGAFRWGGGGLNYGIQDLFDTITIIEQKVITGVYANYALRYGDPTHELCKLKSGNAVHSMLTSLSFDPPFDQV